VLLSGRDDALVRKRWTAESIGEPFMVQRVEEALNGRVEHPIHSSRLDADREHIQRLVRAALRPEAVREAEEVLFVDSGEHLDDGPLDDFVLRRGNPERPLPPVRLRDVRPPNRARSERAPLDAGRQVPEVALQVLPVVLQCLAVDASRGVSLQGEIRRPQTLDVVDVVQQRGEPLLPILPCYLTYSLDAIRRSASALCPVVVNGFSRARRSLRRARLVRMNAHLPRSILRTVRLAYDRFVAFVGLLEQLSG